MPLQFDPSTVGASNLGLKGGLGKRFATAQQSPKAYAEGDIRTFANLTDENAGTSICQVVNANSQTVLVPTRNGGYMSVQLPAGAEIPRGAKIAAPGMFTRCAPQDVVAERRQRAAHLTQFRAAPFQKGHTPWNKGKSGYKIKRNRASVGQIGNSNWSWWDVFVGVGATAGVVVAAKWAFDASPWGKNKKKA